MKKFQRIAAALLVVAFLLCCIPAVFALEGQVTGVASRTSNTQYFLHNNDALSATWYIQAEDTNALGYALSLNEDISAATLNRYAGLPESVQKGIYAILQNGYPSQRASDYRECPGLTDDELRYATAIALYAWMETMGQGGGVDATSVVPSAYPMLTGDKEKLNITMENGLYSVGYKEGVSFEDLASYERAFMVYAHMYNEACQYEPWDVTGKIEIKNATLWTPIDDKYIMQFTAMPTGDYTEVRIEGMPVTGQTFVNEEPNADGSLDFALHIPQSDFDGAKLQLVMAHTLCPTRYQVYSSEENGSSKVVFVAGEHGIVDSLDLPMEKYTSSVVIKITDTASGAPIKGAKVEVYNKGSDTLVKMIDIYPQTANAYTVCDTLIPGDYEYIITSLPVGYTCPEKRFPFTVNGEGDATGSLTVSVTAGTTGNTGSDQEETNTDERTNDMLTVKHGVTPLSGVSISVYNQAGTAALTAASDTAGNISVSSLAPGSYTYKLSAVPDGYAMDTRVRSLLVSESGIKGELDFTVDQTQLSIKKVNAANAPVSGVTYTMYTYVAPTGGVSENALVYTTAANNYYHYTTACAGADATASTIGQASAAGKRECPTCKTSLNGSTTGAVVSSVVTDSAGIARFTGIKRGTYTVKETSTIAGLVLSTDTYTFTVDANWTNSNTPYLWDSGDASDENFRPSTRNTRTITLMHNTSTPIVGATLTVLNSSGSAVLSVTTNSAGTADVSSLAAGSYVYRVSTVPETYAVDGRQHKFEITASGTISGYIDLPIEKATVLVKKGTTSGVTYTLYNSSDTAVTAAITDATGTAKFVGLTLGSFYIKETATVSGMTLSDKKYEFTVTNAWVNPTTAYDFDSVNTATTTGRTDKTIKINYGSGTALSGAILTVTNSAGTQVLTATTNAYGIADVSALATGSYSYKVTSVPSTYAVDGLNHPFTIDSTGFISGEIDLQIDQVKVSVKKVAKDKITPVKGVTYTLYNSANAAVTTAVTGDDGLATFTALVPGTYTIKETATVSDYALSSESYTFTVSSSWVNGTPQVFYSSNTVQTGVGTYILVIVMAAAVVGTAVVLIGRIRKKTAA